MNIKVAAFTESEKSINTIHHYGDVSVIHIYYVIVGFKERKQRGPICYNCMTPTIAECSTYAECPQDNVSRLTFDIKYVSHDANFKTILLLPVYKVKKKTKIRNRHNHYHN